MNKLPKEGQRVRVVSLDIKGTVFFVNPDRESHYTFMYPVQVKLDKPYDDSGQIMYRTNHKDLVLLKPKKESPEKTSKKKKKADVAFASGKLVKKKKKKVKSFDDEVFSF